MVRIDMYHLQKRLTQFKDHKKLKTYLIVRTELFLIENKSKKGRKYK